MAFGSKLDCLKNFRGGYIRLIKRTFPTPSDSPLPAPSTVRDFALTKMADTEFDNSTPTFAFNFSAASTQFTEAVATILERPARVLNMLMGNQGIKMSLFLRNLVKPSWFVQGIYYLKCNRSDCGGDNSTTYFPQKIYDVVRAVFVRQEFPGMGMVDKEDDEKIYKNPTALEDENWAAEQWEPYYTRFAGYIGIRDAALLVDGNLADQLPWQSNFIMSQSFVSLGRLMDDASFGYVTPETLTAMSRQTVVTYVPLMFAQLRQLSNGYRMKTGGNSDISFQITPTQLSEMIIMGSSPLNPYTRDDIHARRSFAGVDATAFNVSQLNLRSKVSDMSQVIDLVAYVIFMNPNESEFMMYSDLMDATQLHMFISKVVCGKDCGGSGENYNLAQVNLCIVSQVCPLLEVFFWFTRGNSRLRNFDAQFDGVQNDVTGRFQDIFSYARVMIGDNTFFYGDALFFRSVSQYMAHVRILPWFIYFIGAAIDSENTTMATGAWPLSQVSGWELQIFLYRWAFGRGCGSRSTIRVQMLARFLSFFLYVSGYLMTPARPKNVNPVSPSIR
jgi:hypothetical protein